MIRAIMAIISLCAGILCVFAILHIQEIYLIGDLVHSGGNNFLQKTSDFKKEIILAFASGFMAMYSGAWMALFFKFQKLFFQLKQDTVPILIDVILFFLLYKKIEFLAISFIVLIFSMFSAYLVIKSINGLISKKLEQQKLNNKKINDIPLDAGM